MGQYCSTITTNAVWYNHCTICGKKEKFCYRYCKKCNIEGRVNNELPLRECHFCEEVFSPVEETFICRSCFDEPHSYQHWIYAAEKYALENDIEDINNLTIKDQRKVSALSSLEIASIRKRIYGY